MSICLVCEHGECRCAEHEAQWNFERGLKAAADFIRDDAKLEGSKEMKRIAKIWAKSILNLGL